MIALSPPGQDKEKYRAVNEKSDGCEYNENYIDIRLHQVPSSHCIKKVIITHIRTVVVMVGYKGIAVKPLSTTIL